MMLLLTYLVLLPASNLLTGAMIPARTRQRYRAIKPPSDVTALQLLHWAIVGISALSPMRRGAALTLSGYAFFLFGQCLVGWAMRVNHYYSPALTAPPVICASGPYKYLKHPAYVGHAASILGVWLIWQSVYALPFLLMFWGLLAWRSRRENRLLAGA